MRNDSGETHDSWETGDTGDEISNSVKSVKVAHVKQEGRGTGESLMNK